MSTAVATRSTASDLASSSLTADQIALVKRQLMSSKRPATDDELALFIYQCDRTGLDPFSRQIYAIYRWDKNTGDERMQVQVSIDGLRLIADRTGRYAPGESVWCDDQGVWRDVWLDAKKPPTAAKVYVRKLVGTQLVEFAVPALWTEYAAFDKQGRLTGLWGKMPALMLAKCAEALALRRAFPNETSGLYTAEEMDQADAQREMQVVADMQSAFDATEQTPPKPRPNPMPTTPPPGFGVPERDTDPDITNRPAAAQAPPPSTPTQAEGVDADAPVTEAEKAAMLKFFDAIGAPESFWRMGLMMLGFDDLTQLNKAQAHTLMTEAEARFKKAE